MTETCAIIGKSPPILSVSQAQNIANSSTILASSYTKKKRTQLSKFANFTQRCLALENKLSEENFILTEDRS